MGLSLGIASTAAGAYSAFGGAYEQRKARKAAEEEAARQREALAALQAESPPAIPTEADAKRGRRRSIRDMLSRRGRRSTILTNQTEGDTLGA